MRRARRLSYSQQATYNFKFPPPSSDGTASSEEAPARGPLRITSKKSGS